MPRSDVKNDRVLCKSLNVFKHVRYSVSFIFLRTSKISWLPVQTADRDWGGGAGVRAAWVGAGPVVQLGAILMPHFMEEDAGPPPTPMPHSIRSQGSITQPPILGA